MNEKELINNLKKGENAAFKQVYKMTFPMIMNIVRRNNGTIRDAKDLMQDAIYVLVKNLRKDGFQITVKPSTYLYAVAKNKWLLKLRSMGRELLIVDDEVSTISIDKVDHDDSKMKEDREEELMAIENAMKKIGEKCKRIIMAFYYKKVSLQDIAEQEGLTSQSMKVTKFRCMKKLKENTFS